MAEFPYFIIEHYDHQEFPKGGWSCIEYLNILRVATPARVIITNMSKESQDRLPTEFKLCAAITEHSLLDYLYNKNDINNSPNTPKVLKDIAYYHHNNHPIIATSGNDANASTSSATPATSITTAPTQPSQICFLDEFGTGPLAPTELGTFQYIIVGGVLGNHPSVDQMGFLRDHGFAVRHLGERQLSTDSAILACCVVLRHGVDIENLEYIDDPEVFEDEIDKIPLVEQIQRGQAKKKLLRKMRESTAVRMRYFTHQQKVLDGTEQEKPRDITCIDRSGATDLPMTQFPCFCDCDECISQRKANGNDNCNINHAGDWYHSRPQPQVNLHKDTNTRIGRITPGLLEHIFKSLDDGLIDLEGNLDIDFEAMELGIDEAEDAELCKVLFME